MKNAEIISYSKESDNSFSIAINKKIGDYFRQSGHSRKATSGMVLKLVCIGLVFLGSYSALLSNRFSKPWLIVFLFLFGIGHILIAFNIGHDASHGALFKKQKWNQLFAYAFNLVGVNSYIWNIKHNLSHHAFTNVPGQDMDIEQIKIARLVEHIPLKGYYKYQHIYVPLLYPFASLFLILIKDFQMFQLRQYGNFAHGSHPLREYIILFVSKVVYFTYALAIPLMVMNLPWWEIVIGFLMIHAMIGLIVATILFTPHAQMESIYPLPDEQGVININWAVLQVESTVNFAAESSLLTWFCGGLNLHIVHHLFPGICHIHYPQLRKIIQNTAKEYGIMHREVSLFDSIASHLAFLKLMGNPQKNPKPLSANGHPTI